MDWPEAFKNQMQDLLGAEYGRFEEALKRQKITSIRFNPAKPYERTLQGIQVPWCKDAIYLDKRPAFNHSVDFLAGAYYVQDASSMFIHYIYKTIEQQLPDQPVCLDLCAAPGGKSTALLQAMNQRGTLISNEVIRSRVKILGENIIKWGASNVVLTNADPSALAKADLKYDVILVDAPCSGEGLFRKTAHAVDHWSLDHIRHCASRQKRILQSAAEMLANGGFLIYSTCTYNHQENEHQVEWMKNEFDMVYVDLAVPEEFGIQQSMFGYRFYPHKIQGEGLFISVLQKNNIARKGQKNKKFKHASLIKKITKNDWLHISSWVDDQNPSHYYIYEDRVYYFPSTVSLAALKGVRLFSFGSQVGKIMRNGLRPSSTFAKSQNVSKSLKSIDISEEEALSLLQNKIIPEKDLDDGWYIYRWKSLQLLFTKIVHGRSKVLY